MARRPDHRVDRAGEALDQHTLVEAAHYLFENGAWKCIQAQITAVAPEHYPADDTIVSVYIKGELQRRAA